MLHRKSSASFTIQLTVPGRLSRDDVRGALFRARCATLDSLYASLVEEAREKEANSIGLITGVVRPASTSYSETFTTGQANYGYGSAARHRARNLLTEIKI